MSKLTLHPLLNCQIWGIIFFKRNLSLLSHDITHWKDCSAGKVGMFLPAMPYIVICIERVIPASYSEYNCDPTDTETYNMNVTGMDNLWTVFIWHEQGYFVVGGYQSTSLPQHSSITSTLPTPSKSHFMYLSYSFCEILICIYTKSVAVYVGNALYVKNSLSTLRFS